MDNNPNNNESIASQTQVKNTNLNLINKKRKLIFLF